MMKGAQWKINIELRNNAKLDMLSSILVFP